jgi:Tfp pilus assembly protein PilZ
MKQIAVTFSTGKDVLNAYWGFLSNGGLIIRDEQGLREGEAVSLEVTIESSQQRYKLNGQVVRRPERPVQKDKAIIAFHPGEPHDLLLSAAWAETDNVPARKHRRFPLDAMIRFRDDGGAEHEFRGRLLNLSFGGCCLRSPDRRTVGVGDRIVLLGDGVELPGVVRWSRAEDLGIEFMEETTRVEQFVRTFI